MGSASELRWEDAERTILAGACQIIASRLLGQKMQEKRGSHELDKGIRELDNLKEANRKLAKQGPKSGGGNDIRL
jgi:hypothetical protein